MNILFYCPFNFNINSKNISSLGGIESLNIELCCELAKKKFNVFLATHCNKEIKKKNIVNIPIKNIVNKQKNINFDVIISSNNSNIFDKFKYAKKVLWMHNTLSIEKSIRKKSIISIIRNKITVVFVSKYLKERTSKLYFFNKQKVINNFLSEKFIIQNLNFKRKKIIVWSVQRDRGLNETIQMWIKNIYPNSPKLDFYIFGIDKKKYKKQEQKLKKYNIYFFGRVSKSRLRNIYAKSMAMICLGYDETFCLNALEANACGLPLLTFAKTALKNYSINNFNSFNVNNFDDLTKKVNSIYDKNINKKMIMNCYKASKKYRLEKVIKLWINLLKTI